ncbi:hypothetical protein H4R20_006654 [Coemansia guatemalensis]|uniref:Uncharacterized protein n=1 Tax=Coemansia guatemalensis TaxID=2761395 RepID=A0A9W8HTC0_9FUNG|nr:hypothetical protein H4R20_006654 [Coemansia guatemalensis]
MSADMLVRHNPDAMQQIQMGKEPNALPAPSTMPAAQLKQPTVSQKIVWILQYLNPLFYARLAQSLVSTVFGSQATGSANNSSGRVTEHANHQISAPAPADASVIDCEYYHISKDDSVQDSQAESELNLGIAPNHLPVTSNVATATEHKSETCNNAVHLASSPIKAEETTPSASHTSYGSDGEAVDLSSVSATLTDPVEEPVADTNTPAAPATTASTTPKDEKPGRKSAKKGKRSKKNKS